MKRKEFKKVNAADQINREAEDNFEKMNSEWQEEIDRRAGKRPNSKTKKPKIKTAADVKPNSAMLSSC